MERPREQISMAEVHDCFSITELVTMADLFLSDEGQAWRDILEGQYNSDGRTPCQIDGGLKCFGHRSGLGAEDAVRDVPAASGACR
jgi:acetyl-CoA C-acetyltransferase